jgi:hypothetical protein
MLSAMLEPGIKIDLVSNCTPPYVHAQIAINCMNAYTCWWRSPRACIRSMCAG